MIEVGDIVKRGDRQPTHARGRVTGFAPNGWARITLDNGQQRIWPVQTLTNVGENVRVELIERRQGKAADRRLESDLRRWVARIGTDRAWRLYEKYFANAGVATPEQGIGPVRINGEPGAR